MFHQKEFSLMIVMSSFLFWSTSMIAEEHVLQLEPISLNRRNIAAQERGAALFFEYCSGCHSLKQMRYSDLANHFHWVDERGDLNLEMIRDYLTYGNNGPYAAIEPSMSPAQAEKWFGRVPPDLSLVTRYRSPQWVYTFLKHFYPDDTRPTGVNNSIMPQTAMPYPFTELQEWASFDDQREREPGDGLLLKTLARQERFDRNLRDIVAFLDYVGEPHRLEREVMGKYVILFLVTLSVINFLYYQSVWKTREDQEPHNDDGTEGDL